MRDHRGKYLELGDDISMTTQIIIHESRIDLKSFGISPSSLTFEENGNHAGSFIIIFGKLKSGEEFDITLNSDKEWVSIKPIVFRAKPYIAQEIKVSVNSNLLTKRYNKGQVSIKFNEKTFKKVPIFVSISKKLAAKTQGNNKGLVQLQNNTFLTSQENIQNIISNTSNLPSQEQVGGWEKIKSVTKIFVIITICGTFLIIMGVLWFFLLKYHVITCLSGMVITLFMLPRMKKHLNV